VGYGYNAGVNMLSKWFAYTIEAVSIAVALVVMALWGFGLGAIVGTFLFYFVVKGFLRTFIGTTLPAPILTFLYVLALWGLISGTQFLVLVPVIIAVFMLKEVKLVKGPVDEVIIKPLKMGVLGGLFSGLIIPIYIASVYYYFRHYKDLVGKLVALVLIAFMFIGLLFLPFSEINAANLVSQVALNPLQPYTAGILPYNPLTWIGAIAYEELIGRATPFANAMFVLLHAPSRIAYGSRLLGESLAGLGFAVFVLGVIGLTTVWLRDIYQRYGIVGSIIGHAVYNAAVSAPILTVLPFIFLTIGLIAWTYKSTHD